MAQLASPQQKSAPSSTSNTKDNAPKASRLGYEILHRSRQSGKLHLPLSLPKKDNPLASTGSALLDAFESDRTQQAIPLRNLRLIQIAGPGQSLNTDTADPSNQPAAHPPVTVLIKSDAREKPQTQPTQDRTQQPESQRPEIQKSEIQKPEIQKQEIQKQESQPTRIERLEAKTIESERTLLERTVSKRTAPLKTNTPLLPVRKLSPVPAAKRATGAVSTDIGKNARDSAAAVGLLDLNDTLLFGGDHDDLSCIDPFIPPAATADPTGVLTYLSQQVSAFTVGRLSHSFPISTDIGVLNQKDEPQRITVLDRKTFKLGNLNEDAADESESGQQQQPEGSHSNNTDVAELTQQLQALNRKVDYLSRKLQETASS